MDRRGQQRPFAAYKGDAPYIFVSYAHEDAGIVYPELQWLKEQGYNVWYDEGISPGSRWSDELATSLKSSILFLFFATPESVNSKHCQDEINLALDSDRPAIAVHLQKTELTPGLELRLSSHQAILKYELADQDYQSKLLSGLGDHINDSGKTPQFATPVASGQRNVLLGFGLVAIAILIGAVLMYLKPAPEPTKLTPTEKVVTPEPEKSAPAVVSTKEPSIAVLPFANISSDPENAYFSDGISEEILNTLVKTNTLPVIARTSSFKFRGEEFDAKEIGEQLKVSHLLEGSVRKSGNNVRITAQLIDVSSGVHLWSDSYNRDITDIFTVQQEIAERIVNQIGIALPSGKQVLHTSQGTTNPAAYELYLLARHLANTGNPFEVEKAIPLYEQALKLEPGFADAWAELGMTYVMLADLPLALRIPAEINPIAANAFRTALEIDPNHARAMGFLGHLLISHEYQWSEGLRLLSQSVDISPHDATVLALYGHWLNNSDHPDASSTLERAYLLNPFDMTAVFTRATQLGFDGRLVDGTALMETALIQNRERYDANLLAALFNATTLRTDIAETYLTKARNVVGNDYPSVKIIDLLIAQQRGHDELATELKMELLALAQHTRVGLLSLFTIGWNAAQIKQVSDIATDQRHGEVLDWILAKPVQISESDWSRFQKATRLVEEEIETRTLWLTRSDEEKSQLRSEAIPLTSDDLASYIGLYKESDSEVQIRMERTGNQLRVVASRSQWTQEYYTAELVPTARNHFENLDIKVSYDFTLESGSATQLKAKVGQLTIDYIKTD